MKAIIVVVIAVLLPAGKDLGSGATITGQVVDARTFQPLRGAVVSVERPNASASALPSYIGFRTGLDGKFILRGVPPGIVNFLISKAGYAPGPYASVRPAADGEKIENVVLTVPPAASIGGRVLDETGQPVSGAMVTVRLASQPGPATRFLMIGGAVTTDDDGQYLVGNLSAGEYLVTVGGPNDSAWIVSLGGNEVDVDTRSAGRPLGGQMAKVVLATEQERMADIVVRFGQQFTGPLLINTGSATISGQVVDTLGAGISHARVQLGQAEKGPATITTRADVTGRFQFLRVRPGSVRLSVAASETIAPLAETGRSTTLEITAGARVENVLLIAPRGGTISGTLTDEFGDPAVGVVTALTPTRLEQAGDLSLIVSRLEAPPFTGRAAATDAKGRYRVSGLAPGEYLVSMIAEDSTTARTEIHFNDHAGQDRVLVPTHLFYPGVATVSQASRIAVTEGGRFDGVDLILRPMPIASINVTVTSGRPMGEVQLYQILFDDRMPMLEKTKKLAGSTVTLDARPGRYRLIASADVASSADNVTRLWGSMDIDTDPQFPATANLALEPGANVSGRIVFEGKEPNRQNAGAFLVPLTPLPGIKVRGDSTLTVATGEFSIEGVAPGRYVIQAGGTLRPALWVLKAAMVRGRDVLDEPFDLSTGEEIDNVVLRVTDRISELSGRVTDASDKPSSDHRVVVFSTETKHWWPGSRRVRAVRPDSNGRYVVRAVPAGTYYVALTNGSMSQDELMTKLPALVRTGLRVTVAEGERKQQDLTGK